jgi:hypothetical protein
MVEGDKVKPGEVLTVSLSDVEVAAALVAYALPLAMRAAAGVPVLASVELVRHVEGDDDGQSRAAVEFDVEGVDDDDPGQVGGE